MCDVNVYICVWGFVLHIYKLRVYVVCKCLCVVCDYMLGLYVYIVFNTCIVCTCVNIRQCMYGVRMNILVL